MKVGDLVEFHYDYRWTGRAREWGYGLIEEKYSNDTFQVYWSQANTSRTHGPKCLIAVS